MACVTFMDAEIEIADEYPERLGILALKIVASPGVLQRLGEAKPDATAASARNEEVAVQLIQPNLS